MHSEKIYRLACVSQLNTAQQIVCSWFISFACAFEKISFTSSGKSTNGAKQWDGVKLGSHRN